MRPIILFVALLLARPAVAFVVPLGWSEKCASADAIVRGVVIDIVQLTKHAPDSRGSSIERNVDKDFAGPHAVAIVKAIEILKGDEEKLNGVFFIPCGFDFDESPAELTQTKEYVFFLRQMGYSYFHPLDPFSMHRMQRGRVGLSGFDTDSDLEEGAKSGESVSYEEFVDRVRKSLEAEGQSEAENPRSCHPNVIFGKKMDSEIPISLSYRG